MNESRIDDKWLWRQLPLALLVTAAVVLLPPIAVTLAFSGVSTVLGVAVCVVLSLVVSRVLASLWQRLPRSRDILFVDLLLWGWVRRLRTERRLARADEFLAQGASDSAAAHVRELERISAMVEQRDGYTHRHSMRVTRLCEAIASELRLPEPDIARVRTAAALHDVGKYYTPRSILNKPDRLTDAEFDVIKRHPGRGAELLEGVVGADIVAMIRHHHERLGGSGYPDGLVGDEIPLGARIIAVADTFDAMTSNRAYRSARTHKCALDVLCEEAGVALDARCVDAFRAYYTGRRGVYWSTLLSGFGAGLASARDFLVPSALVRALPTVGVSAALAVPMLAGSGVPAGAADATGRPDRDPSHTRTVQTTPTPTPTTTPAAAPDPFEVIAASRRRESRPTPSRTGHFTASRAGGRRSPEGVATTAPARPDPPPSSNVPDAPDDVKPTPPSPPEPEPHSTPQPKPPQPKPTKPKPTKPQPTPANPPAPPGNPTIDLPDPPHEGPPGLSLGHHGGRAGAGR